MTADLESLKRLAIFGSPTARAAALTLLCKDEELEKEIEEIIEGE